MPTPDAVPAVADVPNTTTVELAELVARSQELADRGLRFVTATCIDHGDRFELNYTFDEDLKLTHLRVFVDRKQPVPSISSAYLAAFLVENEMKELFGVDIVDIAIDYGGRLYLTDESEPTPMVRITGDAPQRHKD